jgi:hypothetical protein
VRSMIFAIAALFIAMNTVSTKVAAEDHCMTGDSAVCAQDPDCHWDYSKRGCYEGAPERVDPCGAHSDKSVCEEDTSIGCKWNDGDSKCVRAN